MLRYAKKRTGSKAKRKGAKNTGHPIPQWRRANPAFITREWRAGNGPAGEFKQGNPREYADGTEQHRGHVHLPGCECFSNAAWGRDTGSSAEYLAMRASAKQHASRIAKHEKNGPVCAACRELLPLSGICGNCN